MNVLRVLSVFILLSSSALATDEAIYSKDSPIVHAVERVSPYVFNIVSTRPIKLNPWYQLFTPFEPQPRHRLGSGVMIAGGYVLTNQHLIQDAVGVKLVSAESKEMKCEVVGEDYPTDIALLKVKGKGGGGAVLGDSNELKLGEWAIAVGNPFGTPSVTLGVISALHRSIRVGERIYRHLIQTDAAINPGNSGGPLVDINGMVVGINVAFLSSEVGQGVGFAIPIDIAKMVTEKLLTEGGVVIKPWMGMEYQELTSDIARHLRISETQGVLISNVEDKSPAQKAGIKRMDLLKGIAGFPIKTLDDLRYISRLLKGGNEYPITLIRDNREIKLTLKPEPLISKPYTSSIGLKVHEMNERIAKTFGLKGRDGVFVCKVERSGPLWGSGLQTGDRIYAIGRYKIRDLKDFKKVEGMISKGSRVTFLFEREGVSYRLTTLIR
ncbi:TPA: PDZ domain-containing protein [Candidatus Poribacteria bacterium]|nr:PDZ domain-containing protein [Candidatus Poribacteria bacterium]